MAGKKPSTDIGEYIRKRRAWMGLNMGALAKKSGLDGGGLSRIENGESPEPRLPTLIKIADALDVSLDLLVGRVKKVEPKDITLWKTDKLLQDLIEQYVQLSHGNRHELVRYARYIRAVQHGEMREAG